MKYARECSITGEGMNQGWVGDDGCVYFKYEKDARKWCVSRGYRDIDDAYADDAAVVHDAAYVCCLRCL
jgi:hypothetical protein